MPHLDAAYTLARYLVRDEDDAQDAVQEAYLRAMRYYRAERVRDPRSWILAIVRRTCHAAWHHSNHRRRMTEFNEEHHSEAPDAEAESDGCRGITPDVLRRAIDALPAMFREVIVLRDVQGLTYRQIASIVRVPIGTVMSRLARARRRLRDVLLAAPDGPLSDPGGE